MSFEITVLGSSSALPSYKKFPSAHVVNMHERFFLIDCGEGTQIRIRQYKIKASKINHIFISHLHGDHFFGIFGLISSFNLLGRKNDLHIYSPGDLEKMVYTVIKKAELNFNLFFHRIKTNRKTVIYETKSIKISCFPLNHRIETYGYLFEEKQKEKNIRKEAISKYKLSIPDILKIKRGENHTTPEGKTIQNKDLTLPPPKARSYAYCSDTAYYPEIIPYIKGVDLLYHEATFTEDMKETAEKTMHSTAAQAAKIAKEANAGQLITGHFSSRYKNYDILLNEAKNIFENTVIAEDGLKITIPVKQIR
ncbi:MAG: ribonuclease Z [Chlorobi bacterium]|nr:ribonuclease Z [Chlorobiota bacterium]